MQEIVVALKYRALVERRKVAIDPDGTNACFRLLGASGRNPYVGLPQFAGRSDRWMRGEPVGDCAIWYAGHGFFGCLLERRLPRPIPVRDDEMRDFAEAGTIAAADDRQPVQCLARQRVARHRGFASRSRPIALLRVGKGGVIGPLVVGRQGLRVRNAHAQRRAGNGNGQTDAQPSLHNQNQVGLPTAILAAAAAAVRSDRIGGEPRLPLGTDGRYFGPRYGPNRPYRRRLECLRVRWLRSSRRSAMGRSMRGRSRVLSTCRSRRAPTA